MNEMRKQVSELCAVPGGPLWRAAAQEFGSSSSSGSDCGNPAQAA